MTEHPDVHVIVNKWLIPYNKRIWKQWVVAYIETSPGAGEQAACTAEISLEEDDLSVLVLKEQKTAEMLESIKEYADEHGWKGELIIERKDQ